MASSMVVDKEGSVEKRMNMSLDDIIKETSKSRGPKANQGQGARAGAARGRGKPAGRPGGSLRLQQNGGPPKGVSKRPAGGRQNSMTQRRGLQATAGQQARKAFRPQGGIRKPAGRAPLRNQRGRPAPTQDVGNITVSIVNNKMNKGGQPRQKRPIMPTSAAVMPGRQRQQQRQPQQQRIQYQQPIAYQQPVYAQAAPYYASARSAGTLAPIGPSMVEAAPIEYRPARQASAAATEMPTWAGHDYRDGPPPNYQMEGRTGMYADREYQARRTRPTLATSYSQPADQTQYTNGSSQRQRRNERGYIMPGP